MLLIPFLCGLATALCYSADAPMSSGHDTAASQSRREFETLQGDWVFEGGEIDGHKGQGLPPGIDSLHLIIKGNKATEVTNGQKGADMTIKIGAVDGIKTMDLISPDGEVAHAIYRLRGDRLDICAKLRAGQPAPKSFDSKGGYIFTHRKASK